MDGRMRGVLYYVNKTPTSILMTTEKTVIKIMVL